MPKTYQPPELFKLKQLLENSNPDEYTQSERKDINSAIKYFQKCNADKNKISLRVSTTSLIQIALTAVLIYLVSSSLGSYTFFGMLPPSYTNVDAALRLFVQLVLHSLLTLPIPKWLITVTKIVGWLNILGMFSSDVRLWTLFFIPLFIWIGRSAKARSL